MQKEGWTLGMFLPILYAIGNELVHNSVSLGLEA